MHIRSFSLFVTILLAHIAVAQPKNFTKVQDKAALENFIKGKNSNVNNILSDFKQVKNLSLLAEQITSKGKFSYAKDFKVRIEYTEPYKYLVVMNGTKMLVRDEQKTSKINTGNSKLMQSVNQVMVDCMKGTVFTNTDFKVNAYTSKTQYLLEMLPVTPEMKKLFEKIEVYLDKENAGVERLVMTEQGGDYTAMNFYNTKYNTQLNDALFKVK